MRPKSARNSKIVSVMPGAASTSKDDGVSKVGDASEELRLALCLADGEVFRLSSRQHWQAFALLFDM
jgi:hypothetical protein